MPAPDRRAASAGPGLAGADDDGVEVGSHIGELSRLPGGAITAGKNIFRGVKDPGGSADYPPADRVGGRKNPDLRRRTDEVLSRLTQLRDSL